jgi:hypothetical protein
MADHELLLNRRWKRLAFHRWRHTPHRLSYSPGALSNSPSKLRNEILSLRALAHDINAKLGKMEHLARHQPKNKKSKHSKQIQQLDREKKRLLLQIQQEKQSQGPSPQAKSVVQPSFLQAYEAPKDHPNFKPTTLFKVTEGWRKQCFKEGDDYLLINYSERTFLTATRAANCIQVLVSFFYGCAF